MGTLEFILKRYGGTDINFSRWTEYPLLLKDLGFKKGVEIGTYKGQFAETLMKAIPDLDLTAVDAWKVYKDYKDYGEVDLESEAQAIAQERAKRSGFKIMKAWSLDAVKNFEDESLDFVFIDANHDFRHVTEDLDEWRHKVKKGGIVSGHDFFRNHHKGFGVREAVPAYCDAYGIKPLFVWRKDQCPSWMFVA